MADQTAQTPTPPQSQAQPTPPPPTVAKGAPKPEGGAKIGVILLLFLLVLTLVGAGVLGYLYYKKSSDYKNLLSQKEALEGQQATSSSTEDELNSQIETLEGDKTTLQGQVKDLEDDEKILKKYNEVLSYIITLYSEHLGFYGWTDAEYEEGMDKVEATKDKNLKRVCENAWTNESIPHGVRLMLVLDAISEGMDKYL